MSLRILEVLIDQVHELRKKVEDADRAYNAQLAELNDGEIGQARTAARAALDGMEQELRVAILDDYAIHGNKSPASGCGVRVSTKLVYDSAVALAWAKEHRLALQLDKRVFERIAKGEPMEFVRTEQVATATIATDLTKHVEAKSRPAAENPA